MKRDKERHDKIKEENTLY